MSAADEVQARGDEIERQRGINRRLNLTIADLDSRWGELRTAVEEMLAEAKQTNYDRAGKSEFDEGREVAYQYVLDLMNGGRA